MGRDGRELGSRGQKRREVKHPVDFVLTEEPVQNGSIQNRASDFALDVPANRGIQWDDVERDDLTGAEGGEALNEKVAYLTGSARDEYDRPSHRYWMPMPSTIQCTTEAITARMERPRQMTAPSMWLTRSGLSGSSQRPATKPPRNPPACA